MLLFNNKSNKMRNQLPLRLVVLQINHKYVAINILLCIKMWENKMILLCKIIILIMFIISKSFIHVFHHVINLKIFKAVFQPKLLSFAQFRITLQHLIITSNTVLYFKGEVILLTCLSVFFSSVHAHDFHKRLLITIGWSISNIEIVIYVLRNNRSFAAFLRANEGNLIKRHNLTLFHIGIILAKKLIKFITEYFYIYKLK